MFALGELEHCISSILVSTLWHVKDLFPNLIFEGLSIACTILYLIFDIVGRVACHLNNYNTLLSALEKAVLCAL